MWVTKLVHENSHSWQQEIVDRAAKERMVMMLMLIGTCTVNSRKLEMQLVKADMVDNRQFTSDSTADNI